MLHRLTGFRVRGGTLSILCLYFSKAFDTISSNVFHNTVYIKISQEQYTYAYKKCFSESSCNLFIVKVEVCTKGCFVGACPRHDTIIIDNLADPRVNMLIKSDDNIKPGMAVSILKDKLRTQTQEELVRQQLQDCCESRAERELTVPVLPDNACARQD